MKETIWSKLRELWAIRRRCKQIKLQQRENRLLRLNESHGRTRRLTKLFRQTDASSDQPDRAPDSHRRHRRVNPLWLVCIFWFHFFAAIRDKRLNSQHRFQFTGAPASRRRGCVKSGAIQKLNRYPRGICACHRGLKTPRSPTVSSAVGVEYTVSRALQFSSQLALSGKR